MGETANWGCVQTICLSWQIIEYDKFHKFTGFNHLAYLNDFVHSFHDRLPTSIFFWWQKFNSFKSATKSFQVINKGHFANFTVFFLVRKIPNNSLNGWVQSMDMTRIFSTKSKNLLESNCAVSQPSKEFAKRKGSCAPFMWNISLWWRYTKMKIHTNTPQLPWQTSCIVPQHPPLLLLPFHCALVSKMADFQ